MQTELESEEQGRELGAAAALAQVYADQDEGIGPAAAALTAIVPTRKGVELGDLLAASQVLDSMRAGVNLAALDITKELGRQAAAAFGAGLSGVASDMLERARQPMIDMARAGISSLARELPRLMLGEDALESFKRASSGIADSFSLSRDAQDGFRLALGVGSMSESAIEIMRGAGISQGISDSITSRGAWQLNNPAEQALQSMRKFAAEQDSINNKMMAGYLDVLRAEQQQRQEEMLAAFAGVGRWQAPSISWPELIPRQWQVYEPEPEPPAEQIEAVQVDGEITLESLSMALAEGRLPWREVIQLAMQYMPSTKPGRKEPPIPEQLALVEGWYAMKGKMLQERYCGKVGISKASLNRYERNCKALGLI